ncbi:hypothetical protein [Roseospira navarrensis]|uniref:Uncharacterized protein n=1 Tax=Roseospira navarrensis TaxID=140058 RepID=A0A7X1ZJT2_9PROT|nr:hypothetical protein [Roseospira navarrensis]MQX38565.1 hypothetical protein [Roseospira navarrensis]
MTTTSHMPARAIAFTFNDSRNDHPVDVLGDVGDALSTVSDIFIQNDVELSPIEQPEGWKFGLRRFSHPGFPC